MRTAEVLLKGISADPIRSVPDIFLICVPKLVGSAHWVFVKNAGTTDEFLCEIFGLFGYEYRFKYGHITEF